MLIRFRVENYRSIRDEQELSFVADSFDDYPNNVVHFAPLELDLLKVMGIYGANASGKSTILNAFSFMSEVVFNSQRVWKPTGGIPREPFLLDLQKKKEPSFFEVDFILEEIRYTYGFIIDSQKVIEEWLFAYPQGRKQKWFTRQHSDEQEFSFSRFLSGENKTIQSLTRSNSLFLSAAAQNNHKMLTPIYKWFSSYIDFIDDQVRNIQWSLTADIFEDPNYKSRILSIFKNCGLGIDEVEITEEEQSNKTKRILETLFEDSPELLANYDENKTRKRVALKHFTESQKESIAIPFESESRGTQVLFGLAGAIVTTLSKGGILVVDELDSSLHPLMAVEIVKIFNDPKTNPNNAQLLFNTHDTNILEFGKLRRDQIWFTEKDLNGGTHLYPLTDYKARKDENIKRGYLQGRYGAIPFIKSFESLFEVKKNGKKKI